MTKNSAQLAGVLDISIIFYCNCFTEKVAFLGEASIAVMY